MGTEEQEKHPAEVNNSEASQKRADTQRSGSDCKLGKSLPQ